MLEFILKRNELKELKAHNHHLIKVVEIYGEHLSWEKEITTFNVEALKRERLSIEAKLEKLRSDIDGPMINTVLYGEYSARLAVVNNLIRRG